MRLPALMHLASLAFFALLCVVSLLAFVDSVSECCSHSHAHVRWFTVLCLWRLFLSITHCLLISHVLCVVITTASLFSCLSHSPRCHVYLFVQKSTHAISKIVFVISNHHRFDTHMACFAGTLTQNRMTVTSFWLDGKSRTADRSLAGAGNQSKRVNVVHFCSLLLSLLKVPDVSMTLWFCLKCTPSEQQAVLPHSLAFMNLCGSDHSFDTMLPLSYHACSRCIRGVFICVHNTLCLRLAGRRRTGGEKRRSRREGRWHGRRRRYVCSVLCLMQGCLLSLLCVVFSVLLFDSC